MSEKDDKPKMLRVGEIPSNAQGDIGIGIVRMDTKVMMELGIREGEPVEIEGKRKAGAIAVRPYPADVGLDIIRMDGITRRNSGTGIGEKVAVKKLEIKEAKKIVLAPAQKGIRIQANTVHLRKILMGRIVGRGDMLAPSVRRRRPQGMGNFFGMDLDEMLSGSMGFGEIRLMVVSTSPQEICKITELTKLEIKPEAVEIKDEAVAPSMTYEDIGGLHEEVKKVREMIELPMRHPELFTKLGIEPPKGVLLYGPPGTGKTLLAKAVASESQASFYSIAGPEIMNKFYGQSEENIRKIFKEAEENAPSIIFIDEIDSIAPKRENSGEVERRVVAQLLALMDGLESRGNVIVIAATNMENALDPALRRPGRFDREIEIGVPSRQGRLEIIQIHTRNMPMSKDVDLKKLAELTHGYVGADVSALAKEAAMSSLRRVLPKINLKDEKIPPEVLEKLQVKKDDFQNALRIVEPSAMREVLVEIPRVDWGDVGGLENVKERLVEMVEWPLKHPESFRRMGIKPPKGLLLYGLPGTGKTLLAKAIANRSQTNFISIKGPEIFSKYVGESEKHIREVFKRARQVAPTIVFIDEIDGLAPKRGHSFDSGVTDRVVNQMLAEMDGLEGLDGVIVLAATNRPDIIDAGLLRAGRFDTHMYIPIPNADVRKKIFGIYTKGMPLDKDVDIETLVKKTDNYVGADIEAICREAALEALREKMDSKIVKKKHFKTALDKVRPTVSPEVIKSYGKKVKEAEKITPPESDELEYVG